MTDQIIDLQEAVMPGPRGYQGPRGEQGLPGVNAVPADDAVAGYIGAAGGSATKTALQDMMAPIRIIVAAANSTDDEKRAAKYVCTGVNDERVLQEAIDSLSGRGGTIHLCRGTYHIDSITGDKTKTALRIWQGMQCTVRLEGPYYPQRSRTSKWDITEGAVLYVTDAALDMLGDDGRGFVITGYASDRDPDAWDQSQYPGCGLEVDAIGITLAHNRADVTCVDMNSFTRNHITRVAIGVDMTDAALGQSIDQARAVGMRSVLQKQIGQVVEDCVTYGMRLGFDVGGEHMYMRHCIAIRCYTGWRFFGTTQTSYGHPMTCIECSDEVCITGPIFGGKRADGTPVETNIPGLTLINWNREVVTDTSDAWCCRQQATEANPGLMRGIISYQISDGSGYFVSTNRIPFFERGHGTQFDVHNLSAMRSAAIWYAGMTGADIDRRMRLRGEGAAVGQMGWATNRSLLRPGFDSAAGIGMPVYWDGTHWRTYANELAVLGPNLVEITPGSRDNLTWVKHEYDGVGGDDSVALSVPEGKITYKACAIGRATLPSGQYYVQCPEATGLAYIEIVFAKSGNVGYRLYTGDRLQIRVSEDTSVTLRLNFSEYSPCAHERLFTPSIRACYITERES